MLPDSCHLWENDDAALVYWELSPPHIESRTRCSPPCRTPRRPSRQTTPIVRQHRRRFMLMYRALLRPKAQ